ncbi:DUF1285 domain-containing protein [Roseibium suaedae]|uniref:DUF1285 domain-containing protein n=1 Tax=Roseibium suaedae TaxID=735517 RepID=A0A1M7HTE1_9HYPH|nr:DUF1285 domain-containing protein [Roseibium suaedae]SHM31659.1 hypothetical protein SAMN05444272_2320 [Roseibium suaedae]
MTDIATRDLPAGLAALINRAGSSGKGKPPVDKWNPPFCGDLDIRIARDGSWHYMGTPIGREPLVRLFASVLRRDEDGRHYLVTPVEKVGITVEDAPFLAVEMDVQGAEREQALTLRTNVGDLIEVGADHPLRFEINEANGGLKPYVLVRGRLEALFARPLLYELAEHMSDADPEGAGRFGIWSKGAFFPVPEQSSGT